MIILFGTLVASAQTPGIPYQAYIIDTNSGFAPGGQIDLPLANKEITLRFEIRDENGVVEYIEQKTLTTDEYAMVSTVVGIGGTVLHGTFDGIKWNGTPKKMHIDIKFPGTAFQDHGEMDIIYIPSPGGTQTEKGTGPPSPTNPADPKAGDIYVNKPACRPPQPNGHGRQVQYARQNPSRLSFRTCFGISTPDRIHPPTSNQKLLYL